MGGIKYPPPYDDDDDDDNKLIWPTWAVGALFRGARRIHFNRVCFTKLPRIYAYVDIIGHLLSTFDVLLMGY